MYLLEIRLIVALELDRAKETLLLSRGSPDLLPRRPAKLIESCFFNFRYDLTS